MPALVPDRVALVILVAAVFALVATLAKAVLALCVLELVAWLGVPGVGSASADRTGTSPIASPRQTITTVLQMNLRVIPMFLPRVGFVRWFNCRFVLESVLFPCLTFRPGP
jgi:ABC-type glucose/galactose transport system permease subunit